MELGALPVELRRAAGIATLDAGGRSSSGDAVLLERGPREFASAFADALEKGSRVWLASPDWGEGRLAELDGIVAQSSPKLPESAILIPTGGTTGRLRFCVHSPQTLAASAEGFNRFFGAPPHRALSVLPHWHVSGLMPLFRAALSGGRVYFGSPRSPLDFPDGFEPCDAFLSLVPTQLQRILDSPDAGKLRLFRAIVVGGAGLSPEAAEKARALGLPLAPSYGMTESAAVACALTPAEFLAGKSGAGRALPHVRIEVLPPAGASAASKCAPGRIRLSATSLCLGFAPEAPLPGEFLTTSDLGYLDEAGILHVLGRADRTIVSGGEKLDAGEIERAILESGLASEVFVLGQPDPIWGERAAAFYVKRDSSSGPVEDALAAAVRTRLSPRHVPKAWIRLPSLPRTAAGKVDAAALRTFSF